MMLATTSWMAFVTASAVSAAASAFAAAMTTAVSLEVCAATLAMNSGELFTPSASMNTSLLETTSPSSAESAHAAHVSAAEKIRFRFISLLPSR